MSEAENFKDEMTARVSEGIELDDKVVRLIGVPFFGLVIPSATGLIDWESATRLELYGRYLYFVMIAWIVWEGNRYLVLRYYPIIFNTSSYIQKYGLFIWLNLFYTTPVSLILLWFWKWLSEAHVANEAIFITAAVIVVCVIFVTNVYEKVLYAKHSEREQIRLEQLKRGKVQAELEALKNQIDPHFMFNALNSISYLIKTDQDKAEQFLQNLAEVYRYILSSKDKDLVLLQDELTFMHAYARLMSLRYEGAFDIHLSMDERAGVRYLIPPVTLMIAVENAVKHNEVSLTNPLTLDVVIAQESIILSNVEMPRKVKYTSTKIGLTNLNERVLRTTGKAIWYQSAQKVFTLSIPLLKLN